MRSLVQIIRELRYAAVNINNMIPVPRGQLIELNINAEKDPHYKFLLQAEKENSKFKIWLERVVYF